MNEVSLVYYGEIGEVQNHFLYLMKMLRVLPAQEGISGFYLLENKYGKKSLKKLSLELTEKGSIETYLVYRYLNDDEINWLLRNGDKDIKIYVLAHKLYDLESLNDSAGQILTQACFIADTAISSCLHDQQTIKNKFNTRNIFRLSSELLSEKKASDKKNLARLPVLLLLVMKIVFNPFSEFHRYYIIFRYNNLRIVARFFELLVFLSYLVKIIFYRTRHVVIVYGTSAYYQIRHLLLMTVFKTYGLIYDLCMFVHRFTKLVLMYPFFKIYWFCSFQYRKRIKKFFIYDR